MIQSLADKRIALIGGAGFIGHNLALELKLDDNTLRTLDEIFPGPGDEAPMAYAW